MPRKQSRPYVEKLNSNLKSPDGSMWSVELADKTLIVGPNRSGKSRITQSLELALVGSADDLIGRDEVKDGSMLMGFVSSDRLAVGATLSDGEQYSFVVNGGGRPSHTANTTAHLPLRDVREAIAGSATTARKAFLGWTADGITHDDVLALVPSKFHNKMRDILTANGRNKNTVDALLATLDYVGKRQRDAAKEVSGAEAVIASMSLDLEERPTQESIDQARADLTAATTLVSKLRDEVAEQTSLPAKIAHVEARLASEAGPTETGNATFVNAAHTAVEYAASMKLDACPLCSSPVGNAHLVACRDFYEGEKARLGKTRMPDAERWKLMDELTKLRARQLALSKYDSAQALSDAAATMQFADAAYSGLNKQAASWEALLNSRRTVEAMSAESETYKELKKCLEVAVGELLKRGAESFSARVRTYLPDGWHFDLQLNDSEGREVFKVGLSRGGKLNVALSGVEWAGVTLAIAMTISENVPQTHPLLFIPEDRGWDAVTLSEVMRGYSEVNGQVVIATTTMPSKPPSGWKIINLSDAQVVSVAAAEPAPKKRGRPPAMPKVVKPEDTITREQPATSGTLSPVTKMMLAALGFDEAQVIRMSPEVASGIIAKGLSAAQVDVGADGSLHTTDGRGNTIIEVPSEDV